MADLGQLARMPVQGGNDKETIQMLQDAYRKLRRELEYVLTNLDSQNIASITTDLLVAGKALIKTALIEELEVGTNVLMGANATISWDNVTGLSEALSNYVTTGVLTDALANTLNTGNFSTIITREYIASMNLIVGDEILMGANAQISWANVTGTPTIPTESDITQITADYIATPNLVTNIGTVNNTLNLGSGDVHGLIQFENLAYIESCDDVFGPGLYYHANTHFFSGGHVDFTGVTDIDFTGAAIIGLDAVAKFG